MLAPRVWAHRNEDQSLGVPKVSVRTDETKQSFRGVTRGEKRTCDIASTYVNLLSEFVDVLLAVVTGSVRTQGSAGDLQETRLCAAALAGLAGLTWSAWYNWRRTGSLLVTVSVTVLQLITGGLIVLILMLHSRPQEKTRAD
ncbi:hypothetical protein [Bradyrhizobium sp. B117]|uniref:hypothetical protein n=1 Tax=Bradyrhizobium sp. B117 TaxID=3140246 RepID=UPI003182C619